MVKSDQDDGTVIAAIGNFDGVHIGHQALIEMVCEIARDNNAQPGVVLFEPHPRTYFRPDQSPFLIMSAKRRDELLRTFGIEVIHILAFDDQLAALSPQDFVEQILTERLQLSGVIVGRDFRFGQARAGDGAMLHDLGQQAGISVHLVDTIPQSDVSPEGISQKVGSSDIREAITRGDMRAATAMLGRSWDVCGQVLAGQQLGRTIGFPTANLLLGDLIAPAHGVYAVRIKHAGQHYTGVANYGRRPTVGSDAPLLEVHLFDFTGDLYDKHITVQFVQFLREERKFDGLEPLKAQISRDCEAAKAVFEAENQT